MSGNDPGYSRTVAAFCFALSVHALAGMARTIGARGVEFRDHIAPQVVHRVVPEARKQNAVALAVPEARKKSAARVGDDAGDQLLEAVIW